jgi:hypothetical protein
MLSMWLAEEILDEVAWSNPVNPQLEDCWDPEKIAQFSDPWNSLINTVKSNFFDCSSVCFW